MVRRVELAHFGFGNQEIQFRGPLLCHLSILPQSQCVGKLERPQSPPVTVTEMQRSKDKKTLIEERPDLPR